VEVGRDRTAEQFDITPGHRWRLRLGRDGQVAGGRARIEPHVKLMDKSQRMDGNFSRSDFAYDTDCNLYVCPGGKELRKYHRAFSKPR
jgi:hypothetical protein